MTAANSNIRKIRLHSDQGFTHFFLNETGYELREDFVPRNKGTRWSLRCVRDPQTNGVTDLRLLCGGGSEIKLPFKLDGTLQKSEFYTPISLVFPKSHAKVNPKTSLFRKSHLAQDQDPKCPTEIAPCQNHFFRRVGVLMLSDARIKKTSPNIVV